MVWQMVPLLRGQIESKIQPRSASHTQCPRRGVSAPEKALFSVSYTGVLLATVALELSLGSMDSLGAGELEASENWGRCS